MKKVILLVLILTFLFETLSIAKDNNSNFGIEIDTLPYLTGGYYLSGWYGQNKIRTRAIIASIDLPEFVVKDGFKENELEAYAIIIDYFPNKNFEGSWYGGGLELWNNRIKAESDNTFAKYTNYVATFGGGYVWYFHKDFYINPWGAIHGIVGGDNKVNVGTQVFEPSKITGEVSFKIGWKY